MIAGAEKREQLPSREEGTERVNTSPVLNRLDSTAFLLLALAGIIVLAAVIRFYNLGQWGFWIDEVYEVRYAQSAMQNFSPTTRVSLYLTGLALQSQGVSEWSARLVPAFIGIFTIPILYFPIRRMLGSGAALLSVFFLAISPWHLYWSQNARFYTLLMLFYALSAFFFYFWLERDRLWLLLLAGLFLVLAVQERQIAAFMAPVGAAYILALLVLPIPKPLGLHPRNLALLIAPVVLFVLYDVYSTAVAGSAPFYQAFAENFLGYQHNPIRVLLSIVYDVGLPLFILSLGGGGYLLAQRSRTGLYLLIGALLPLAIVVMVAPFVQAFSRYVFITLPFYAMLAAVAVKELFLRLEGKGKLLAVAVLLVLVAGASSEVLLYNQYQNGNRPDWKGAFSYVEQNRLPGDRIVTTRTEIGEYYTGEEVLWTQGMYPTDVTAAGAPTWFIIDNRTGFVAPQLQEFLDAEARLVSIRDVPVPGKVMEMRVYLYQPDNGG